MGINDYSIAPLTGCVNDAVKMNKLLSRNQDNSPNFTCKLFTAPSYSITRPFLREQIQDLFASDADVALFYFSGHGFINNLGGYLVTQDAAQYDEGIYMNDVLTLAINAPIREIVIILDCCHSGALGENPNVTNQNQSVLREGISILTSSRKTQLSFETGGAGVFTSLVCDALDGGASDVLGNVTVASIYNYVDSALGAWDQRALFKSHVSKLIPLRYCTPEIDPAILRLLPEYFLEANSEHQLDSSYEPRAEPKNERNEQILLNFQKLRNARLLVTVGEDHLYDAAMKSKSCKLTPLGRFYWKLAQTGRL